MVLNQWIVKGHEHDDINNLFNPATTSFQCINSIDNGIHTTTTTTTTTMATMTTTTTTTTTCQPINDNDNVININTTTYI